MPTKKRDWLITVSGVTGVFDTKTGGGTSVQSKKYFGGGNLRPTVLKDRAEHKDIVVGRAFNAGRDLPIIALLRPLIDADDDEHTVLAQPLTARGLPDGPPIRYVGSITDMTDPEADSENGMDQSEFQLTLSVVDVL